MPTYEFEQPDGTRIERFMSMSTVPSIGATVDIDGVTCTRVMESGVQVGMGDSWGFPHVSRALPKNFVPPSGAPVKYDKAGRPIMKSARHKAEVLRGSGYERE